MSKKILLIITGGIAAYKSLELIRLLKKADYNVKTILTKGGAEFVTPLSIASLSGEKVYEHLFDLTDEIEMGHIRLSREANLIVVCPASADFIARLAHGFADDLATTTLLASATEALICPAMNVRMWENAATQTNINLLQQRGYKILNPEQGDMACGEFGFGRLPEATTIFEAIELSFIKPLKGKKVLITAGATREPIDPVRFISNHSSGKQGYAIAEEFYQQGAEVTLISGFATVKPPLGVKYIHTETAQQMYDSCLQNIAYDIAICTAAVSDWSCKAATQKIKKSDTPPSIQFIENPDILKTIANHKNRPKIVIGFAAETENVIENAKIKIQKKGCDIILANDVSENIFGSDENKIHLITNTKIETWEKMSKKNVAKKLCDYVKEMLYS
jgi:phosphopantothenoylcysteine decarboxylase/phosphopantothenate--cysteine ligase